MSDAHKRSGDRPRGSTAGRVVAQFFALLVFWFLLSGQFNALFVGMGVVCAALVTLMTQDMVGRSFGPATGGLHTLPVRTWRFARFALWLLLQIPPAGLQIAHAVLRRRMPVEPCVLRFRTRLESQVARTLLANSITLIPGTLTIAVDGAEFTVHAFAPRFADDLVSAKLQNRVGHLFLQEPEDPPTVVWDRSTAESEEVER
jgi:multicomponent Na+:H+ antiporter subunit E